MLVLVLVPAASEHHQFQSCTARSRSSSEIRGLEPHLVGQCKRSRSQSIRWGEIDKRKHRDGHAEKVNGIVSCAILCDGRAGLGNKPVIWRFLCMMSWETTHLFTRTTSTSTSAAIATHWLAIPTDTVTMLRSTVPSTVPPSIAPSPCLESCRPLRDRLFAFNPYPCASSSLV